MATNPTSSNYYGTALAPTLSRRRYCEEGSDSSTKAEDTHTLLGDLNDCPSSSFIARRKSHVIYNPRGHWPFHRCTVILWALATFAVGFLAIMLHVFFQQQVEPRGCDLFYMYPNYIRQNGLDLSRTRFASKYRLYLYREGGVDELLREPFRIPILFIPGNAGSYKQVRSIAATASRQFDHARTAFLKDSQAQGNIGFDFFSLDLNEEFTALHGFSLHEQAEFVNDAIAYILSVYSENRSKYRSQLGLDSDPTLDWALPESVILIGHSMGGVVARTAITLSNYRPRSVNTILTLSSPHLLPPAPLESYVDTLYRTTNEFWIREFNQPANRSLLTDMSLVSIAGGNLDAMVGSDLAFVDTSVPANHGFTVFTTQIPGVWLSMDHQSILWCKQMADVVSHTLMGIVNARLPGQTKPLPERMRELRRWLVTDMDTLQTEFSWASLAAPNSTLDTPTEPPSPPTTPSVILPPVAPSTTTPSDSSSAFLTPLDFSFPSMSQVIPDYWNSTEFALTNAHLRGQLRLGRQNSNPSVYPFPTRDSDGEHIQWEFFSGRILGTNLADVVVCRAPRVADVMDDLAKQRTQNPRQSIPWQSIRDQFSHCFSVGSKATHVPAFSYPQPIAHMRTRYNFLALPPSILGQFDAVLLFYAPPFEPTHPFLRLDMIMGQQIQPNITSTESQSGDFATALASGAQGEGHTPATLRGSRDQLSPVSHRLSISVATLLSTGFGPMVYRGLRTQGTLRSLIHLDVPDNPLFAYWITVHPRTSVHLHSQAVQTKGPAPTSRFPLIIFQSDVTHSEGRFWYNQTRLHIDFHKRGPYVPTVLLDSPWAHTGLPKSSNPHQPSDDPARTSPHTWPGLTLTLFADPEFIDYYTIEVQLDWYHSLSRVFKRYEMVLVGLLTIYVLFIWKYQWQTWNKLRIFPSFPAALRHFARYQFPYFLAGLLVLSFVQSQLLVHLAHYQQYWVVTPESGDPQGMSHLDSSPAVAAASPWFSFEVYSFISNLFLGYRGDGTWLVLLLLSTCALGVVVVAWALFSGLITMCAWALLAYRRANPLGRLVNCIRRRSKVTPAPQSLWFQSATDILNSTNLSILDGFDFELGPVSSHPEPSTTLMRRASLFSKPGQPSTRVRTFRQIFTAILLLLAVATIVPYQFAFCSLWVMHFFTCVKTEAACMLANNALVVESTTLSWPAIERGSTKYRPSLDGSSEPCDRPLSLDQLRDRLWQTTSENSTTLPTSMPESPPATPESPILAEANSPLPSFAGGINPTLGTVGFVLRRQLDFQMTVLLFLLLLLPYNMPEIVVWLRNLSVSWTEDAASDHNVFWLGPFLILIKFASAFMPPLLPTAAKDNATELPKIGGVGVPPHRRPSVIVQTSAAVDSDECPTPPLLRAKGSSDSLHSVHACTPSEFMSPTSSPPQLPATPRAFTGSVVTRGLVTLPTWTSTVTNGIFNLFIILILALGIQRGYYMYTWGTLFAAWVAVLYVGQSNVIIQLRRLIASWWRTHRS
ncbi:GPI inositol deacylase [Dimargaris cristalligena]|nr:GPI inositol deacylase [Dimargaris cristalligena]